MFKRKKVKTEKNQEPTTPPPPKILRETRNFRIIINSVPFVKSDTLTDHVFKNQLIIESRRTNTMGESFWQELTRDSYILSNLDDRGYGFSAHKERELWEVIREIVEESK